MYDNFEGLLISAEQHLAEAAEKEKEALNDSHVLDMDQIYMDDYHIKSFDGRCWAMSDSCIMKVKTDVLDDSTVFSFITLTNGATIIIDNYFGVAHYTPQEQIHFVDISADGDIAVNEEGVYITTYDDSDLYRIGSSKENNALCLDICGLNYNEGTPMLMWPINGGDNQKFILEKIVK